ncbi:hypothetical protein RN001_015537 [Aquatica leii]|uniref:Amino acid transporter transmembrane domain-containing protein n=1 Tax=Aquatica leii TaxID=1421715 RepID=A0AAN7SL97_9COLE|nr:hypothetical protein RN001_015537 [Aquatica leii]
MEMQTFKNYKNNNGKNDINLETHSPLVINEEKKFTFKNLDEYDSDVKYPTNYAETLMHLFKGNVGPGIFAMGHAVKNSGVVLGSFLILLLGLICLHCEHLLVDASNHVKQSLHLHRNPDFAPTVELCFATGPPKLQNLAPYMRKTVNLFLCMTQLGFCCVYFVFISSNIKQIMDYYNFEYSIHLHMAFILVPILCSCVVRNLKYITPLSTLANVCMVFGIVVTLYYTCQKPFQDVDNVAKPEQLPLFFGTALYAFEGIGLVLPLQNEMKKPKQFGSPLGVLNIGLTAVIILFILTGVFSYLHYGEQIQGSVSLNLPKEDILAQSVKVIIPLGVLLSFALQFYIPIDIMFPVVQNYLGPFKKPAFAEIVFRIIFVLITFTLAEIIPFLDLFISLVGAFCSTAIALIFPPVLEIVTKSSLSKLTVWVVVKNCVIIGTGLLGCVTGTYESIRLIARAFKGS